MHFVLADKLVVPVTAKLVTQAIDMVEANAVEVDVVVESNAGSFDLEVTIQQSNDLDNWSSAGSAEPVAAIGPTYFERNGISSRYVRLLFDSLFGIAGAKIILSATIETTKL